MVDIYWWWKTPHLWTLVSVPSCPSPCHKSRVACGASHHLRNKRGNMQYGICWSISHFWLKVCTVLVYKFTLSSYHYIIIVAFSPLMPWQLASFYNSKSVYTKTYVYIYYRGCFQTSFLNTVPEPTMIPWYTSQKNLLSYIHHPKGHAQRCPQLVPTHRARSGWHCATLQWPRVEPQVSQVCPVSVVPRQLIAFLVGLNVGWTQTLSYDSYDSSYDWYLYKYSILLYVIWGEHIMKPVMKATAISWNQSHLSKRQSGNLGVTSLDDGEGLGWHLLNLGNLSAQIPPTRSARLRDVERWNREPKRHLTMRFTPSNLYYSVTSQFTYQLLLDFSQKDDIKSKMISTTCCFQTGLLEGAPLFRFWRKEYSKIQNEIKISAKTLKLQTTTEKGKDNINNY